MEAEDLVYEFKLNNSHDQWGNCLQWLFAVCEELYFNRGIDVPSEWQYRPSMLGASMDEAEYPSDVLKECSDDMLLRFGWILHRYADILKENGKDY